MSDKPQIGDAIPSAPASEAGITTPSSSNAESSTNTSTFTSTAGAAGGKNFEEAIFKNAPIHEFALVETPKGAPYRIGVCLYNMGNLSHSLGNPMTLKYNKDVTALKITSNITSFGYSGKIQLALMDETANIIKAQISDLMCVITIIECLNNVATSTDENKIEKSIIYQPYVFAVESFEDGPPTNSPEKVYEMQLLDFNSYHLKNSSYGNLREKFPDIANSPNFTDVYKKVINFLTEKKAALYSGFSFTDIIEFSAVDSGNITDIVKMVLTPFFDNNARSLYDLLSVLQNKATLVTKNPDFSSTFDGEKPFSDPMTTLFLMEEYPDLEGSYYNLTDNAPENPTPPHEISYNLNGMAGAGIYMPRKFFLRTLRMPFELAFADKQCTFLETINPKKDKDGDLCEEDAELPKPILGYSDDIYKDCASHGIDSALSSKHWQNVAVMYDANGGGNSYIIYFNWIYEYFNYSHLNAEGNIFAQELKTPFKMAVDPAYLAKQKYAADSVASLEDFTKYNSATIDAKTINREQESSHIIAEKLKACILANECYVFDVNGKVFRRINEIIKVNSFKGSEPDANTVASKVPGGANALANGFALLYIGGIEHSFSGNAYTNTIIGYNFARFKPRCNV